MLSGLFQLYALDRSISHRRGVWLDFIITSFREYFVFRAKCIDPDQTPCSTASDLGLHCVPMSLLGDVRHKCVQLTYLELWLKLNILHGYVNVKWNKKQKKKQQKKKKKKKKKNKQKKKKKKNCDNPHLTSSVLSGTLFSRVIFELNSPRGPDNLINWPSCSKLNEVVR